MKMMILNSIKIILLNSMRDIEVQAGTDIKKINFKMEKIRKLKKELKKK